MRTGDGFAAETTPVFGPAFAAELETLLHWRRDVRHFEARPVPEADMRDLLRCACLAPSVGNAQPWRFLRLRSPQVRAMLADHIDVASGRASERYVDDAQRDRYRALKLHGVRDAPELMAIFCHDAPSAGHGLGIATMPEMLRYSTVLAIHNLWLAARVRGIGVGWVSILEPQAVSALLDVPAHWSLIALLCIGYPAEQCPTPELERRGWQAREPWSERVFDR
ncbi:5,6-dimethylbenzimidazole synthase [Sphingomonas bisphenolicum]|uniref:5,6-dimethylbenzimidazole synthase n=1 Tax=Sphingomonas bisphenolicum TaxID=296544 RepID=A0ABM7G8H0_9SPHN|nr:5,6-dimethylbenzimidazole synthase [Sphingomonas bisphenolicum]BBF71096.1 5,6-dimethylbenzimidazole synthase [Sphingomonas bisphenolicum]